MSDGRLVANDRNSLKIFDARGVFLRQIGRAGSGPGEFQFLNHVCVFRGDSLLALSNLGLQMTVFDSSGRFVRRVNVPEDAMAVDRTCANDGSVLAVRPRTTNPASPLPAVDARRTDFVQQVIRVSPDGSVLLRYGYIQGGSSVPLGPLLRLAARRGEVISGDGSKPEYRVHDSSGRVVQIVRWVESAEPIPPTVNSGGGRVGAAAPVPDPTRNAANAGTFPFYTGIRIDGSGRVWLRKHPMSAEPLRWIVFSVGGAYLGSVLLPDIGKTRSGVEIDRFIGSAVVLRWVDSDGVKHLTVHTVSVR
jgi:hypothetical protein